MSLLAALGLTSIDELDPSRPLYVSGHQFSPDAASEAIKIFNEGIRFKCLKITARNIESSYYWSVMEGAVEVGEIFAFTNQSDQQLSTAVEIAIIRALAIAEEKDRAQVLAGGCQVAIMDGEGDRLGAFPEIALLARPPQIGRSLLWNEHQNVEISGKLISLNGVIRGCIDGYFSSSPLKFRFIEIYRIIESLFLNRIYNQIVEKFDREPRSTLESALKNIKSELSQILAVAENEKDAFISCYKSLKSLKNNNKFARSLFKKLENSESENRSNEWRSGASLIYFMRCAIVHSGSKDIIFESFDDGVEAVEAVLLDVEDAALRLIGVRTW